MGIAISSAVAIVFVQIASSAATVVVPDQYPSIQAAMDAASSGDTVHVKAGTYAETLRFKDGIHLEGEDASTVTVRVTADRGIVLTAENAATGSISGITFEHAAAKKADDQPRSSLFLIRDSSLTVTDCVFRKGAKCGIVLGGESAAEISRCRVETNSLSGIVASEKAKVVLRGNQCSHNAKHGIVIHEQAQGTVEENVCTENGEMGIIVAGEEAAATLRANTCAQNRRGIEVGCRAQGSIEGNVCKGNVEEGIYVAQGADFRVVNNACEENGQSGLAVVSPLTRGDVRENVCHKNKLAGLWIWSGAHCDAVNNACSENLRSGIFVGGWRTSATLQGNECSRNKTNGITVYAQAAAAISGNTCRENGEHGIYTADEGTTSETEGNVTEGNVKGDIVRDPGKPLARQDWMGTDEVGWALYSEQFEWLESLVAELRKYRPKDRGADSVLGRFYDGLEDGYGDVTPGNPETYLQVIARWREAFPDSVTPLVALAGANVRRAWDARGCGWASQVTEEGWKGFETYLEEARKVFLEAKAKAKEVNDPQIYTTMVSVAMGQGLDKQETRAIFDEGVAIDNTYSPLYASFAFYLQPRWHGRPGEMEAFISETLEAGEGVPGGQLYAALAGSMVARDGPEEGRNAYLSWPEMDQGYQELLAEFPDSTFDLNRYCVMACLYEDRPRAQELFARIGDTPDLRAWWSSDEHFRRFERWANGLAPYPVFSGGDFMGTTGLIPQWAMEHLALVPIVIGGLVFLIGVALVTVFAVTYGRGVKRS